MRYWLLIFSIIFSQHNHAQMKNFPSDLYIGQNISIIAKNCECNDSLVLSKNNKRVRLCKYDNPAFKSLGDGLNIISSRLLTDTSGTVQMIRILFSCEKKPYFELLKKFLPDQKAFLERYGVKSDEADPQIFDYILRYKDFFISMGLNAKSELYLSNGYENAATAILTIGVHQLIGFDTF